MSVPSELTSSLAQTAQERKLLLTLTIIRVSSADQKKKYGPEAQWTEDILPAASLVGVAGGG